MPIEPHVVRVPFGRSVSIKTEPPKKPFAAWDESDLAEKMRESAKSEGKWAGMPPDLRAHKENGAKSATGRQNSSRLMIRLLLHLQQGNLTRSSIIGLLGRSGNSRVQMKWAKDLGWVKGGDKPNEIIWITSTGLMALAEMRANAVEENGRLVTGGSGQYGRSKQ